MFHNSFYLHLLQLLIYLAILELTQPNSPWGYGIGVIVPTGWNCLHLFVWHLFQKGAVLVSRAHGQFWFFLRICHVSRPETMIVMVGRAAHFLIIVACVAGFPGQVAIGSTAVSGPSPVKTSLY
jgi:hypothetical protein